MLLLFFSVILIFCGIVSSQRQFVVDAKTSTIDSPFLTGLHVKAGEMYKFHVPPDSPDWACSASGCSHDANGGHVIVGYQSDKIRWYVGSLIARVGEKFYFVGTGPTYLVFENDGEIGLLYWDNHYPDNSGSMKVIVEHIESPAPGVSYVDSVPMQIMKGVSHCTYYSPNIHELCIKNAIDTRIDNIRSLITNVR